MKIEENWNTWKQVMKKVSYPLSRSHRAMPELNIYRSSKKLFRSTLFHYSVDLKNKINDSQLEPLLCGVCTSPHFRMAFLHVFQLSPTSQRCACTRWISTSILSQSEWVWVWGVGVGVGGPAMEEDPVQGGSHFVPWAARRDFSHPQPWNK